MAQVDDSLIEGGIIRPHAQARALTPSGPSPLRGNVVSALNRAMPRSSSSARTRSVLLLPALSAIKKRARWARPFMAEREGFEPSIGVTYTPLAGARLQPLGHLSGTRQVYSK